MTSAAGREPPRREPVLREVVSAERVRARIEELAGAIARDFGGASPLFVVIAEGARRFAAAIETRVRERREFKSVKRIDSLVVRARRTEGQELSDVRLDDFDAARCSTRDVLVLDDIADEGRTLAVVIERVRAAKPHSLRVAVLVNKTARCRVALKLDYVGFEIPDGWIVGFGMDLDGRYRELDHLAVVEGTAA